MKTRTLKLRRDTLRTLTTGDLATVQGGRLGAAVQVDGQPVAATHMACHSIVCSAVHVCRTIVR